MDSQPTSIREVRILTPEIYRDERGFFLETFRRSRAEDLGIKPDLVQDNLSGSNQGVLRGLHYQIQRAQGKLVRAVVGEIFDVAVDLRQSSESFGQWVGVHLSAETYRMLWVPAGFAHGFYVLSEWAEVLYKTTDYYAPEWERTLRWDDPAVGIEWPLIDGQPPILSEKDAGGASFEEAEKYK